MTIAAQCLHALTQTSTDRTAYLQKLVDDVLNLLTEYL